MTKLVKDNLIAVTSAVAGALLLFSGSLNLGWVFENPHPRPTTIAMIIFVVFYGMMMYTVWMNGIRRVTGFRRDYRNVFVMLRKHRKNIEWTFREDIAGFEGKHEDWTFRVYLPGDWNDWGWQFEARRKRYSGVSTYWSRNGNLDEDFAELIDDLFLHAQMAQGSWNVQHNTVMFAGLKDSLKRKKAA